MKNEDTNDKAELEKAVEEDKKLDEIFEEENQEKIIDALVDIINPHK